MQGISIKILKNHIFFSHYLALRRKCGKRVGILCRNSLRYLQGTGFPYLCKGKIKAPETLESSRKK